MARRSTPKQKQKQLDLIALAPPGSKRIKVRDISGKELYRDIDKVRDGDEILTKEENGAQVPIVMRGSPGRRKSQNKPVTPEVKEITVRKKKFLAADSLLKKTRADPDSSEVLHEVLMGISEEVGSLAFERLEAERKGEETSQISVRRIQGLKSVAETWLRRRDQLGAKSIDIESPAFQAAMQFVLETMKSAMVSVEVQPELIQTIFSKFAVLTKKESWEPELKTRIKNTIKT
jgi:hypothetical protein